MSCMTPASKLKLQANDHRLNTPITATHYQKLPTLSEKKQEPDYLNFNGLFLQEIINPTGIERDSDRLYKEKSC